MKSNLMTIIAGVAIGCLVRTSVMAQQTNEDFHCYFFKEKRALVLDDDSIAIRHAGQSQPNKAKAALQRRGVQSAKFEAHSIRGWSLGKGLAKDSAGTARRALLKTTAGDAEVGFTSPVFKGDQGPQFLSGDILIAFDRNYSQTKAEALLKEFDAGTILDRNFGNYQTVRCYRTRPHTKDGFAVLNLANRMAIHTDVRFAEPAMIIRGRSELMPTSEPNFGSCWGLHNTGQNGGTTDKDMDVPEAWDFTIGTSTILIAVLDTGVQQNHPDINQVSGEDVTDDASTDGGPVNQYDNHGTAVAGCISATLNNGIGTVGVAPNCRILSIRTFKAINDEGNWDHDSTWTVNALERARIRGARVSNNSNVYGTSDQSPTIALKYDELRNLGMVHFACAGNDTNGPIRYPANLPSVNAVSAIDRNGLLANFSNHGPGLDFAAPGVEIWTTDRTGTAGYNTSSGSAGDYVEVWGTSFASPYVAGVAALILSMDQSLTAAQVETYIQNSCVDLGPAGYDTQFGHGLVNAYAAVAELAAPTGPIQISTLTDLQNISQNWGSPQYPDDGYYILMNDIDANATKDWDGGLGFKPMGNDSSDWFRGTFDGQGHQITRLYCTRPAEAYAGLFSVTKSSAIIKNLTVEVKNWHAKGYANHGDGVYGGVGILVGDNWGLIENCHVSVNSANHMYATNGGRCGGIVGENNGGAILNCSATGTTDINTRGTSANDGLGGIAGVNSGGGLIKHCWVGSSVTIDGDVNGAQSDGVGGIVGENEGSSVIECESRASANDGRNYIGGIVGVNSSGGVVVNSYYRGNNLLGDNYRGGIAGRNVSGTISNCYVSSGISTSGSTRGALVGENSSLLHDCYWNSGATALSGTGSNSGTVSNAVGRTSADLMLQVSFTNWDFAGVWIISEGVDYPVLRGAGLPLASPTGLIASSGLSDGVHLSWNSVPEAAFYRVYRANSLNGARQYINGGWVAGLNFVDANAIAGTNYSYWVKAAATPDGARGSDFSTSAIGSRTTPSNDPLSVGLVAYYPLNGNANDATTNGNHGTIFGSPTTTNGVASSALFFDGVDDYVIVPRSIQDDFSISLWMSSTQVSGNANQWYAGGGLVDADLPGGQNDFGVSFGAGKAVFGTGNPDTSVSSYFASDGLWHHIVATRQKTTGTLTLYVDGRLAATYTGASTASLSAATGMCIGSLFNVHVGGNNFLGFIDEVRIYNRVLPLTEIQTLASADPLSVGLVAHYPFNGNANDASANGLHGYPTNSVTATWDRFGNFNGAFSFNGADDHVGIPASAINDLSSGSITAWIFLNDNSGGTITAKQHDGVDSFGLLTVGYIPHTSDGQLGRLYYHPHNNEPAGVIGSSSVLTTGAWHHVAVTFSSTSAHIYIDGQLDNINLGDYSIGDDLETVNTIGGWIAPPNDSHCFFGRIDDIRIYNRTLATSEIQALAGSQPVAPPIFIKKFESQVVLLWANSGYGLQASPTITGTFTNILGASSPYTNNNTEVQKFFRLKMD